MKPFKQRFYPTCENLNVLVSLTVWFDLFFKLFLSRKPNCEIDISKSASAN